MFTFLKDIIAPKKCFGCKTQGHFLCPTCEKKLTRHSPICYVCKKSSPRFMTHARCKKHNSLDQILLYAHYRDTIVSKLIKQGKFHHKKDIWGEISKYYVGLIQEHLGEGLKNAILVPVPMYFWKKSLRGYNQSELLAQHIRKALNIPVEYKLFKKIKNTPPQSHLTQTERLSNLNNSFQINEKLLDKNKKKTIIIIDDVISTGVTLHTLSQLLNSHGAHHTIGCIFASD